MSLTLIFIVLMAISIIISAFFSASETAVTAVSLASIHRLSKEGNKRAKMVEDLRKNKEAFIGAILLGNNLLNILSSALATTLLVQAFGEEGVVYATMLMTVIILIFAEIFPKTYAFNHAESLALYLAPTLKFLVKTLTPITSVINLFVKVVLSSIERDNNSDLLSPAEALKGAIELSHHEGQVHKFEKDMLGSILDMSNIEVESVMTHRKNVVMYDISLPASDIIQHVLDSPHTRIPLWRDSPDNIVKVLHLKDILRYLRNYQGRPDDINIEDIAMDPWFIPETTILADQLHAFQKRRSHMAIVVDEYGVVMGIVTLEDILEQIVGLIDDEHDDVTPGITNLPDKHYLIDATMTIRAVNRHFDWSLPDDVAHTIAGLIMHETESIPEEGESFTFHGIEWTITAKQQNQITQVKVKKQSKKKNK